MKRNQLGKLNSIKDLRTFMKWQKWLDFATSVEYGAGNFQELEQFLYDIESKLPLNCHTVIPELIKRVRHFKGYLIAEFSKNLSKDSDCATHCMDLPLSPSCIDHTSSCHLCNERWSIFEEIQSVINGTRHSNEEKAEFMEILHNIQTKLSQYISHMVRSVYQRQQFQHDVHCSLVKLLLL